LFLGGEGLDKASSHTNSATLGEVISRRAASTGLHIGSSLFVQESAHPVSSALCIVLDEQLLDSSSSPQLTL